DGSGFEYTTWSVIVSNINSIYYTANWQIQPDSYFFDRWPQGKNFIHIRVFDLVPTQSVLYGVFYVLKDTLPPIIDDLQEDATYFVNTQGTTYNVDFKDLGIGVTTAQYCVAYSSVDFEATKILDWTNIFSGAPQSNYTTNWQVAFESLQEWATNYVFVRCFDGLAHSTGPIYVFSVLKDTTPPTSPQLLSPQEEDLLCVCEVNFEWSSSFDTRSGVKEYELQVSTVVMFGPLYYSTITTLTNHTTIFADAKYIFRVRAKDYAGNFSLWSATKSFLVDTKAPTVVDNQDGYNVWLSSDPGPVWDVDFKDIGSGITTIQYRICLKPGNFDSDVLINWTNIYSGVAISSYTINWGLSLGHFELLPEGTSYVSVRCFDKVGLSTTVADVFYIRKDTSAPTLSGVDSQGTTDTTWRNTSKPTGYDVNFHDPYSLLKDAWYCVSTNTQATPPLVINWTPIFSNLNSAEYLTNWNVSFGLLIEATTNYVSVRVRDNLLHMATYYDVFFVLKDVTKPTIVDNTPENFDSNWYKSNPGSIYDVDFFDKGGSKLQKVQTKVMTGSLLSGATVWDWADTILAINSTYYTTNWSLNFDALSEGKNFISVRAYDNANNFETLIDAFFVLKDTTAAIIVKNSWEEDLWYAYPPTVDIDFVDTVSGIEKFDIIVSTDVEQGFNLALIPWITVLTTNTYSYTQNWQIPQIVFDTMVSGVTNYCWVRVFDFAGNVSTSSWYFMVKKDTAGVEIVDNEAPGEDSIWRNNPYERTYNVDFYSLGVSKLSSAEYTAYTASNMGGVKLFDWKEIPGFVPGTTYFVTDWRIGLDEFENLKDSATNYISVRCKNEAGSVKVLLDVFVVKKDTTAPSVPLLSFPLNGQATNQLLVNFTWQPAYDLASGVFGYEFYVSTTSDFSVFTSSFLTTGYLYLIRRYILLAITS
ncbi:MAG: hypothetical protein RMI01_08980, partial [Thermodesulfovibrio sp.]|nr:hypothetical protein [Thermodesulfovibrio sp.]